MPALVAAVLSGRQHSTQNGSSCRIAEKAGPAAEGTTRSAAPPLDGWHDRHLHARLA